MKKKSKFWPVCMSVASHGSGNLEFWGAQDTYYPREYVTSVASLFPTITGSFDLGKGSTTYSFFYLPTLIGFDISSDMKITFDFVNNFNGASETLKTYDSAATVAFREISKMQLSAVISPKTHPLTMTLEQMQSGSPGSFFRYMPYCSYDKMFSSSVVVPGGTFKSVRSAVEVRVHNSYQSSSFYSMERIVCVTLEGDVSAAGNIPAMI